MYKYNKMGTRIKFSFPHFYENLSETLFLQEEQGCRMCKLYSNMIFSDFCYRSVILQQGLILLIFKYF